jgi:hypothetical protein
VGVLLLVRARALANALCPEFPEPQLWVVRVLGARLVVQQAVVLASPARRQVRAAAMVDGLHAASMVPLLWSPRYRRAALISGGYAALFAVTALAVAPRTDSRAGGRARSGTPAVSSRQRARQTAPLTAARRLSG